jgi:AcrR family transcriptional regulator
VNDSSTHGEKVKARIIAAGLELWRSNSASVTARGIGAKLDMTHSAILYHFGTANGLRNAIAAEAVRIGDSLIVPQLITARHPAVAEISINQRREFLADC